MMKGSSFDTRFLIQMYYSADSNELNKIRGALLRAKPNYLSAIALSEIYRLSLQKEGRAVADLRANSLTKDFHIVDVNSEIAIEAAVIKNKKEIPLGDSLIAATSKVMKVPCFTDDPHFKSIEGVQVKWID